MDQSHGDAVAGSVTTTSGLQLHNDYRDTRSTSAMMVMPEYWRPLSPPSGSANLETLRHPAPDYGGGGGGGIGGVDGSTPDSTVSVQRNLIKQLQRLVLQQATKIEELQSEIQRGQSGTRETDVLYLDRLQNQQDRLDERQTELQRVRSEADMFRKEIEHLRAMMGGLESEANERERMYSQVYSHEKEKIDRDRVKQAEALERLGQENQRVMDENALLRSRVQEAEVEVAKGRHVSQEEQRSHQISRREVEALKHEKLQLFDELKREQREREEMEGRHRKELEEVGYRMKKMEQGHKEERIGLATRVTEMEIRNEVLESQVQRLEMEVVNRAAASPQPPHHASGMPGSAVVMQLGRSEEEVNRLRQQVNGLEQQKRQYYAQVNELEGRLAVIVDESRRAAKDVAVWQEQKVGLEKVVKGLSTEVTILKQDLCRSREKNAALEQSFLEIRVQWQREKAVITEQDQDSSMKTRALEQELREREMELDQRCRNLEKLKAAHADLKEKYSQLSVAKNGVVNELVATMASHDEDHQDVQAQLRAEVESCKEQVRDLMMEVQATKTDGRAQVERAARSNEGLRKEVHDLSVEMGRLRIKLEEKEWQCQKVQSALEAAQQRQEAEGDVAQHLKDSLQAATREIEKLRKERDCSAREARVVEERLRAEVAGLLKGGKSNQSEKVGDVASSSCSQGMTTRRRCETALAPLGGRLRTGLNVEDSDDDGGDAKGWQAAMTTMPVRKVEPWGTVARILDDHLPKSGSIQQQDEGSGSSSNGSHRRMRYGSDPPPPGLRTTSPSRYQYTSGPRSMDAPMTINSYSHSLAQGSASVGRGSKQLAGGGAGGAAARPFHGEHSDIEFGCWSGVPTNDTDDSFFLSAHKDRAAPPLEPPMPPLPSITHAAVDDERKQQDKRHHHQAHKQQQQQQDVGGEIESRRSYASSASSLKRTQLSSETVDVQMKAAIVTTGAAAAAKIRKSRGLSKAVAQSRRSSTSRSSTTPRPATSIASLAKPISTGGRGGAGPVGRKASTGLSSNKPLVTKTKKKNGGGGGGGERVLPQV